MSPGVIVARAQRAICSLVLLAIALVALDSPADAAFPGKNGKLTVQNGGVYSVDPDGSNLTPLAPGADGEWSPDGTKIAFENYTCSPSCGLTIWKMNADGSGQIQLTAGPQDDLPSWSPDGNRIVFHKGVDLWIMNADGSSQSFVTSNVYQGASWSPDGTRIAFASNNRLRSSNWDIYTIHPDGTGLTRLTTVTAAICDPIADSTEDPDWSPDGQKIVYVYEHDVNGCPEDYRNGYGLHVMNADGSGDTELVPTDADEPVFSPSWSPDGTKVAYDRSAQAFYVNVQGGPETLITPAPPRDWQPLLRGYARSKGATPLWAFLTVAFKPCASLNETHAAPLSSGSCAPPQQASNYLTVGTSDANGAAANSTGSVRYALLSGDLGVEIDVKDVRNKTGLTDYTGELAATAALRITDKANSPVPNGAGTVQDTTLPVTVPCAATTNMGIGSTCALSTTENTLTPGLVVSGMRAIWQLGQVQVYDGGSDGDADTTVDNTLFMGEGIFVP